MSDYVVVRNEFFTLDLSRLTVTEHNLLVVLFALLRESKCAKLSIPFIKIKRLSKFPSNSNRSLAINLLNMNLKLRSMTLSSEQNLFGFHFFSMFELDLVSATLTVSIDPELAFIIHSGPGGFTCFSQKEFVALKGKYTKLLFLLLKRYRSTGIVKICMEEFRTFMGVPKGYATRDITEKIVKVSVQKLQKSFQGLSFSTHKGFKRGAPITRYDFQFQKEKIRRKEMATDAHLATTETSASPTEASVATSQIAPKQTKKVTSFFDYPQRQYDYAKLERQLLAAQERERESDEE